MIGFAGTSLQFKPIITAHNQWLPKTRSIPYWTMSVFSSTVTNHKRRIPAHILNSLTKVTLTLTLTLTAFKSKSKSHCD
jgi:hypothetical protein